MVVNQDSLTPINFDGLKIFDYTAGQNCGSSVALIEVPPSSRHEEAWSKRSDKYYLVTDGRIRFSLDGDSLELKKGDFCLVRKGQRFSYSNERSQQATLVLVHTPSFNLDDDVFTAPTI